jgi:hypothetical protein
MSNEDIARENLPELIADNIRKEINTGKLKPGVKKVGPYLVRDKFRAIDVNQRWSET